MKKSLMIAVAAMAVTSQAATIQWQLAPNPASAGYAAGQTVLLFVGAADETFTHGTDTGLSLSEYVDSLLADGADAATEKAFDTATTAAGRAGVTTAAKTKDISYDAGSDIVGMIVVLNGDGKYSGFSFSTSVAPNGYTMLNTGNASSDTGGFVDMPSAGPQIPEPATGALALAGLALLFRRRR